MSVEDHADLKMLGSELGAAVFAQAVDGYASSPREAEACNRAAAAVKTFVTKPGGPLSHGLGGLAQSIAGIDVLASLIELLRHLLVEAGHANDDLGNATMDYHDLGGIDDAIRLREASNCPAARSLAKSLSLILSRTELQPGYAPEEIPPSTPEDTSWIEACSRIGQRTLRWALDESDASLNFAGGATTLWPGPALYGYDDWEANPVAARELCDALGRDEDHRSPILCGTHEASILENLAVPVPAEPLKGARHLYVTESETVPGALFCQATSLRMDKVAQLIKAEQALEGYPWDYPDDFEEEFCLYAFGDEVEIVDGMLPLRETSLTPDWARPDAKVVLLGVDDHFEITEAGRFARSLDEWESEFSDLPGSDLE